MANEILTRIGELVTLLNQQEELWLREMDLESEKRDLRRLILEKNIEVQKALKNDH